MRRLLLALSLAALCSCGGKPPPDAPQATIQGEDTVVFAPGSAQLAQIVAAPVQPRREMSARFNGRLVWNEDRTVRVFAPFGGRVMSIAVRPGDRVKAGDTLAVLAAPELGAAQAEARKAEQDYALAEKNLARVRELYDAGVAPAKDFQAAQADRARTEAELQRTREKLKLYGKTRSGEMSVDQTLHLKSAIAGVVVERNLNPGQEVRPDSQGDKGLFVVSDPSRLWFLLDVAEKDIGLVKPGEPVMLSATSLGEQRVAGRIVHVAEQVDPQTRTVKVRGTVDAADPRLKAEMYVVAELRLPVQGGFVVAPSAVFLRGERHYVFVDAGGGRFERRAVEAGALTSEGLVVLHGIGAGDKVVVDGGLLLEHMLENKG
ncbi:MAG TPA: efflux RND transporter periplasmic adaptor subunit [Burkholderiales bacterium]|nr:efflux RND transporter periplasmic adaptor subunit [Burkholderiales bacterium]